QRSQQVYSSDQFASLTGPEYITQIAFRPSVFFSAGPFTATFSDIQVDLSTTLKTPDNLSLTFANNIGSDDTTVLHGPLAISSTATGSQRTSVSSCPSQPRSSMTRAKGTYCLMSETLAVQVNYFSCKLTVFLVILSLAFIRTPN